MRHPRYLLHIINAAWEAHLTPLSVPPSSVSFRAYFQGFSCPVRSYPYQELYNQGLHLFFLARRIHGTILLWCSISDMSMWSPFLTFASPLGNRNRIYRFRCISCVYYFAYRACIYESATFSFDFMYSSVAFSEIL